MMTILYLIFGILIIAWIWSGIMLLIGIRRICYIGQFKDDKKIMQWPLKEIEAFEKKHPIGLWINPRHALQFNKILKDALKEKNNA